MELSMSDLRELVGSQNNGPFRVGQKLFIRTVTYHLTGEVVSVDGAFLTLRNAAWIADSGRYQQAIESSTFDEVEPYPDDRDVYINTSAIVDAVPISTLPRSQK